MKVSRHAFTLIELLVAIAIIAVLIGLLLSAVQKVRESANKLTCQNNVKQITLGLHHFNDARGGLPAGVYDPEGNSPFPSSGWQIPLLPFIEQQAAYDEAVSEFKRVRNFGGVPQGTSPHLGLSRVVKSYVCPSDSRVQDRFFSAQHR